MKVWLIRHPKPAVIEGTCYGRSDVGTDDSHFEQVVQRLRALHGSPDGPTPAHVYSSPLRRCASVATTLSGAPWPAPVIDPLLAEMHFGDWEGRAWQALPKDEIACWRADIENWRPPGGETVRELADRGWAFLRSITPGPDTRHRRGDTVAVLTHAGVIQTLLKQVRGEPLTSFGGMKLDFGSIALIEHDDAGWRVISENR